MPESPQCGLISVVILSFNKTDYTRQCLESLTHSTHRPIEVIVVDQGSTDGSRGMLAEAVETLASADIAMQIIQNEENVGAPGGRNQGMDVANGDFVAFLDNDIAVKDEDWLGKLTACLNANPRIGICAPKLLFPGKDRIIEFAGCGISKSGRVKYIGRGESADLPQHNVEREVQALISACVILPRAALHKVGHMDLAYSPVQYEDLDYCYRLKEQGYTCYFLPSVEMYHYEHVTTDGTKSINFRTVTLRNGTRFKRQWQHLFAEEDGPSDDETQWQDIDRVRLTTGGKS